MKKIILLASALSSMIVWGQADPKKTNDIPRIFPATPETYSMFKAEDFPVDYRTGKLNVSVPLYEIKTRYGVSIPIGLTYNTGGIKVDEMSGIAGLGWSLAIPNTISVEIHGKEDLNTDSSWFPKAPNDYTTQYLSFQSPNNIHMLSYVKNGIYDTEPDIFHYNLPTVSGSFIKDSGGNFRTIPYDDVKISYGYDSVTQLYKFTIIDSKGIIYTLKGGNMNESETSSNPLEPTLYTSSFVLEKIKFPNNEEISFTYKMSRMSYDRRTYSFTDIYMDPANTITCPHTAKQVVSETKNIYREILLTEINHDGEKVNLNYTNTIQGTLGRKDLGEDLGNGNTFALSGLTATYQGTEVKKMALEHNYFNSIGSGLEESYKKFRLKLNKVKNLLDNTEYSFEYNENHMPYLSSLSQDIWGYYNGAANTSGSSTDAPIIKYRALIPRMQYFNNNYNAGGDRSVNPSTSQAYILKKIVYPTKGSSSFTYENNSVWRPEINQNTIVGGLRIKSIDDFDGQTNYTKRTFEYTVPNTPNNKSSGYIASPLEFLKTYYTVGHSSGVYVEDLCENYALSADQSISSALSGKDAAAYAYVTENTLGKGKKVYQFPSYDFYLNITQPNAAWNPYLFLNKNLLNEKSYSVLGDLLQEKKYTYKVDQSKNALSPDQPQGVKNALAISTSFAFYELQTASNYGLIRILVNHSNTIQSGKWLLTKSTDKNYLNNTLTSETINTYSLDDINKPINLTKTENLFFDGSAAETSYQYAHEKGHQKLINANMVAIPLESAVTQKRNVNDPSGKIISKTETKYDHPSQLLPTSLLSYDLQNIPSTEVTYDKYDAKGNLQQYTTKDGISTVIIWGYNGTQPIAKIENAKLENIGQSLIDGIVNESNLDAVADRNNDETNLLEAFKTFKSNLSNYQITTYSYDPLIGVRSITPPSGIREVYLYDDAGRLKEVREHKNTGKLLKEFNYHYKN